MCGIIGCVKRKGNAVLEALEGLRALEYRGYDSAGIAAITGEGLLKVIKDRGSVDQLASRVVSVGLSARVAIGHTRWATHGPPCKENAHPLTDCKGTIAIAHNGTIANYHKIRRELESRGHVFSSLTDSEVIAHLIEEGLEAGLSLTEAVASLVTRLEGSYAIVVISTIEPGKVVCLRKDSPLVVGVGEGSTYCASDVIALLRFAEKVMVLNDYELAELTASGVSVYKAEGGRLIPVGFRLFKPPWEVRSASKGDFEHYTIKEIHEQPLSLLRALKVPESRLREAVKVLENADKVFLVGCGTSFHAALATSYIFQRYTDKQAIPAIGSEFPKLYARNLSDRDALIAISQSGETADTLKAVKCAKMSGSKIISLVNVPGSSLERISHITIHLESGPEVGVAATKSYTSQLLLLFRLALLMADFDGSLDRSELKGCERALRVIPRAASETLRRVEGKVTKLAKSMAHKESALFLGRAWHWATAEEGALKLKELSYIHAEAYPAGEMKHGPIALIRPGFPVIIISGATSSEKELINNLLEVKARGGWIITVSNDDELNSLSDEPINVPYYGELTTLITHIIPLQLLAYYTALNRGLNPDRPRNLAKSVTVE